MVRVLGLLAALTLLAACGGTGGTATPASGGDAPSGTEWGTPDGSGSRVTVADGSMSLVLPPGWEEIDDDDYAGRTVLAATMPANDTQQLIINRYDGPDGPDDAEGAAVYMATGISQQGGSCQRREADETFGEPRLVFDCPFTEPMTFRKVLIVLEDGARAAVVLFQTDAPSLTESAEVMSPILDSVRWE